MSLEYTMYTLVGAPAKSLSQNMLSSAADTSDSRPNYDENKPPYLEGGLAKSWRTSPMGRLPTLTRTESQGCSERGQLFD